MSVQVRWNRDSGVLVADLSGRIDSANSGACANALASGIGQGEQSLILNLSRLEFISSAGLRVLLMMAKKFTGPGRAFALCELSEGVAEVVALGGFADVIPVHGSQAAAVSAITGSTGPPESAAGKPADVVIAFERSMDFEVVGENISDIANFTIEKHEFSNPELPRELRDEAYSAITDALWEEIEKLRERRRRILAGMFVKAGKTLDDVLARADG